jgi:hypothetical protein
MMGFLAFGYDRRLDRNTFLKLRLALSQASALRCYRNVMSGFHAPIHDGNDLFSWGGNGGAWSSTRPPDLRW